MRHDRDRNPGQNGQYHDNRGPIIDIPLYLGFATCTASGWTPGTAGCPRGTLDAAVASALDAHINRTIAPLGGLRVWQRRPQGAQAIEPFGPPQPDWPMLAKLKHTMDPQRLFNPGRFLPAAKEDT